MANRKSLSIDVSGTWSEVQARKVLEALKPEAEELGLTLRKVDISTFFGGKTSGQFLIVVYCRRHNVAIGVDEACKVCMEESK